MSIVNYEFVTTWKWMSGEVEFELDNMCYALLEKIDWWTICIQGSNLDNVFRHVFNDLYKLIIIIVRSYGHNPK